MINILKKNWSYVFFFVICTGFMFAEIINNRFWLSDFTVYYTAASRLLNGINLYQHPEDLHYIFKYSPTSASFFIPFLVLPLPVAKVIYWFLLSFVIAFGFYLISKILQLSKTSSNSNLLILTGGVLLAVHFIRELHLGQVNYIIMISFILILYLMQKPDLKWLVSFIWAAGIFIKPFGFILVPYFIVKKRYKELLYFVLFLIVLALLPLLFYQNWDLLINQYKCWFQEINVEMASKSDIYLQRNHTIFSVIARYFSLSFILKSANAILIYKIVILSGLGVLFLWIIQKGKNIPNSLILEFSLLMATIPLLAFTTENAFCYTALLMFLIIKQFKQVSLVFNVVIVVCFLFIGANFSEIIGKHFSALLDNWSVISIGTFGLIFTGVTLRYKKIV